MFEAQRPISRPITLIQEVRYVLRMGFEQLVLERRI